MITTQGTLPVIDSCGCSSQALNPASSLSSAPFPEPISLEPLTASLASDEVARVREILGVGRRGQVRDEAGEERTIGERSASRQSAEVELQSRESNYWSSFKSLCKEIWSCLKDAVANSWIVENIKCKAEWLIECAGKCVSSVRDIFRDSVWQPRGIAKGIPLGSKTQQVELANPIPKIVVTRRSEGSRLDGRRRSRLFVKRGKQPDDDQEFINLQDECEVQPSPKEQQTTNDDSLQEKRMSQAKRRIREIDSQYGTTPNNPKVADLLSQLGTHYDSIERAIEAVYALQFEELLEEQRKKLEQARTHAYGLTEL